MNGDTAKRNTAIYTGDSVLDGAAIEYKRMGNIDVFNNMIMFAFHPGLHREVGCPHEITNDVYADSPFAAVFKKMVKENNK